MPISNEDTDTAFDFRQSRSAGWIRKNNDVNNIASSTSETASGDSACRTHLPSLQPNRCCVASQEGSLAAIVLVLGHAWSENNFDDTSKNGGQHLYNVDVKMLPVSADSSNIEVEGPVSKREETSVGTHAVKTLNVSEAHQHATLARNITCKEQSVHEKPQVCDECGLRFNYESALMRHMLTHMHEKPYECNKCRRRFSQKNNLTTHMLIHTNEKSHVCSECGQRFLRKINLCEHMLIHTNEKPHICSECGQKFAQKSTLQRHMLTHTGEKSHVCSECGRRFSLKGNLATHMLIHTKEKPHVCNECGQNFSRKSTRADSYA